MNGPSHRPPVALRSIALFEIAKGVLAMAAAFGLLSLRRTDLHSIADAFLLQHGIDPETHYRRLFIEKLAAATRLPVGQVVGFACVYAIVRFVEGFGLWYEKHWAEWFAVISAGLYIPLEVMHLVRHPSFASICIIFVNLGIMFYLGKLLLEQRRITAGADPPTSSP